MLRIRQGRSGTAPLTTHHFAEGAAGARDPARWHMAASHTTAQQQLVRRGQAHVTAGGASIHCSLAIPATSHLSVCMAAVYCMMRIRNPTRGRKVVVLTKSSMSGGRGMDGEDGGGGGGGGVWAVNVRARGAERGQQQLQARGEGAERRQQRLQAQARTHARTATEERPRDGVQVSGKGKHEDALAGFGPMRGVGAHSVRFWSPATCKRGHTPQRTRDRVPKGQPCIPGAPAGRPPPWAGLCLQGSGENESTQQSQ
jgi:hypothetical protein